MSHKINPLVVLDFETGGLNGSKNAVTEVAMLCVAGDSLLEVGRYQSYIQPYLYEYDQKALDFTGTTLEKLHNEGKPLHIVGQEMFDAVQDWYKRTTNTYTKKPTIVGHNITFDIAFLQQIGKECKIDWSKVFDGGPDFWGKWQPEYINTLNIGKLTWGNDEQMNSYKLSNCIQKAEVSIADAHSAMDDVIATKELLISYVNRLRNNSGSGPQQKIRVREAFHFQIPPPEK